jgi:hypothetical protein
VRLVPRHYVPETVNGATSSFAAQGGTGDIV